jgi:large subunit ribosomal protein L25
MDLLKIDAISRAKTGKGVARKLRMAGSVPGVVYGDQHEPVALSVPRDVLERTLRQGANILLDLRVDGAEPPSGVAAIIKAVPRHPLSALPLAVDFQWVALTIAIEVEIPVVLEGVPAGVKLEGGVLEQLLHVIHVKCLPTAIPERITLDVSEMAIGDSIHVSDLPVPEDVEVLSHATDAVANVAAPRVMEEAVVEVEAGEELAEQLEEGEKGERPERGERGERGGRGD